MLRDAYGISVVEDLSVLENKRYLELEKYLILIIHIYQFNYFILYTESAYSLFSPVDSN